MNNGRAPQVKEVLAQAPVAGTPALPVPHMRKCVLDRDALPQFCPALGRLLPRPQLAQEPLIRVNRDTPPLGTAGAPRPQRTGGTRLRWEVDDASYLEGDGDRIRAANRPLLPIQRKGGLREASSVAHRPGLAGDGQLCWPLPDQRAAQIPAIDVQFGQSRPS